MRYIVSLVLLLMVSLAPAWGFVEQLHPAGGLLPCHAMGAILRNFAEPGGPTAPELGTILEREFVPGGWTPQDTTDNSAIIALMNSIGIPQQRSLASFVEDMCILWELGVDEVDSPAEFRARIGIVP